MRRHSTSSSTPAFFAFGLDSSVPSIRQGERPGSAPTRFPINLVGSPKTGIAIVLQMPAIGGKYELGERLGGGGMADVFHATVRGAEGFSRPVAIKRIKRSISTDKNFGQLFVAEARLAAKLHHPNIVQTLDFNRDERGCYYLVMERIYGVDLRDLSLSGRLPVSACCFIASELLRGLDYAHELVDDGHPVTVIHRDISPHNVMLGWGGDVKIVDFGIAKAIEGSMVSRSGSLKGKVAYMSPEQVHGHGLDGRSDVFAVGVILHELLTGQRLFVGKTEAETLSKVLTMPIANPRALNDMVPPDLDAIVMKLLARDRANRYMRARDAMEELLDSSVSSVKGRRDLETLLLERFPEKAPKRNSRLSKSESPVSGGWGALPDASGMALDATAAANSAALRETVPNGPRSKPVPKRTVTAEPSAAVQRQEAPAGSVSQTGPTVPGSAEAMGVEATALASREVPKRTLTETPFAVGSAPGPVETAGISESGLVESGLVEPGALAEPLAMSDVTSVPRRSLVPVLAAVAAMLGAGTLTYVLLRKKPATSTSQPRGPELIGAKHVEEEAHAPVSDVSAGAASATGASADAGTGSAASASVDAASAVAFPDAGASSSAENGETAPKARRANSQQDTERSKSATVTLRVLPWALVTVDGKSRGPTPQTVSLRRGKHRIVLENPDLGKRESFSVTVKDGETKTISKNWQ